jgi:hypothetical protein
MRYTKMGLSAAEGDAVCTEPPTRISPWVIPLDEIKTLFDDGHGTAPDLMYVRGMPATPDQDLKNVNKYGAHSFSWKSDFTETSDVIPNSRRRARNTPLLSWPSRSTG